MLSFFGLVFGVWLRLVVLGVSVRFGFVGFGGRCGFCCGVSWLGYVIGLIECWMSGNWGARVGGVLCMLGLLAAFSVSLWCCGVFGLVAGCGFFFVFCVGVL